MALTQEDLQAIRALFEAEREHTSQMITQSEKRMITRIEDAFEMSNDMMKDLEKRINTRMDDGFARVDGKLAGLRQGITELRADVDKGFKEVSETITEVVDTIDAKIERLETTA